MIDSISSLNEPLRDLQAELHRTVEELARLQREYRSLRAAHQNLLTDEAQLRAERDAFRRELRLVLDSTSWRVASPLRRIGRLSPPVRRYGQQFINGLPKIWRSTRLRQLQSVTDTLRAPKDIAARIRTLAGPGMATARFERQRTSQVPTAATFTLHAIQVAPERDHSRPGRKGRLVCVSHVLPYPHWAGNKYRIHRMLTWLSAAGWDVMLVVCPLPDEPIDPQDIEAAAAQYANLVVCQRDGTLFHNLGDDGALLQGLCERRVRAFARLLGETTNQRASDSPVLHVMRTYCPDLLIELLLHLEAVFDPAVLIAEYVFMARPFDLFRPGLFKVLDTHDVFSTRQAKVAQFGIDELTLPADVEARLLNRADVVIGIQPSEAEYLRKLVPQRTVISVGVDFSVSDRHSASSRSVVLLVGSANAINLKSARDFLRFAWPLVLKVVPDAELQVAGGIGDALDPMSPGVRVLGRVEELDPVYADARVVINPAVAGTGLKIKTVEALSHLRPVVAWPAGVDGLVREERALCRVAHDWFDFSRHVIEVLSSDHSEWSGSELAQRYAAETVYAPLASVLDTAQAAA